ncbi:hypothetical protein J4E85_010708 [Alternaria conjuncta]|uniref:uncharacterized protein n=1 Tax=Alternaria conjuncta TaxID=181017 RepID=UPI00221F75E3|nr:uncharacterized protein J4E85_010708 [Alternaria conjuncta]KAI4914196.1 hypothetical protein J4E85_010708 [Alternaria conjuncta]
MHSVSIIAVVFGLFASQATATIALGNNDSNNLMWIYGDNSCSGVVNPNCGSPVKLRNGFSYVVRGCGTDTRWIENADGGFNAQCSRVSPPFATDCGVQLTWKC